MVTTGWPFIQVNETGVAFIQNTMTKVTEIAECHSAYRWNAEQIHCQLPGLTLPQIHAALGYYFENKSLCDAQIEDARSLSENLRREHSNSALLQKLRGSSAT